ncbi:MAG: hydrogenase nickel incorporation protein HypB [Planctomycetota bacterium]|jgi:hydrogenase nickel incorporation protein HypB
MKPRILEVRTKILKKNDEIARAMRTEFDRRGVFVVNLVSSPGAGKTELLVHTLTQLNRTHRAAAVVGDLATEHDAERLAASGATAKQILTGTLCHLEADMVEQAIDGWSLDDLDFLFIENVGNLVCPTGFDLGEDLRVLLFPVTEGEDKPQKYPTLINTTDVVVLSKVDLAEAVEFDVALARRNVGEARPGAEIFETSARSGQGIEAWVESLRRRAEEKRRAAGRLAV